MADKKKLSIKPSQPAKKFSAQELSDQIEEVVASLYKIFEFDYSSLSYQAVYNKCYIQQQNKNSSALYKRVNSVLIESTLKLASSLLNLPDNTLLATLQRTWASFKNNILMIKHLTSYVDKTYVAQNKLTSFYDTAIICFRDNTIKNSSISSRVGYLMISEIQKERGGYEIERDTVKTVCSLLIDLGMQDRAIYRDLFEEEFLQETQRFYTAEAQEILSEGNCPQYLLTAEIRLKQENDRAEHLVDLSSKDRLLAIVDKCFIGDHAQALISMSGSGLENMFNSMQLEELSRMYNLYSRNLSTLHSFSDSLSEFIIMKGKAILNDPELKKDPVQLIHRLLKFKNDCYTVLHQGFKRNNIVENRMKIAFETFLNENTRAALAIAMYVDNLLRKEIKNFQEDQIDVTLDQIIHLFRFISDKDIFENYYKIYLAKRLLSDRISEEAERKMISKLKTECGYQFASKLEGMFNDVRISKEALVNYTPVSNFEITVRVLTSSFWPSDSNTPILFPREIKPEIDTFTTFYLDKYSGRRLTWKTHLGNGEVRAWLHGTRYDLSVTTYQMFTLLQFNTVDRIQYSDLLSNLQVNDKDFTRHIYGLLKVGILQKSSSGREISGNSVLSVNENFTSRLIKISVPVAAAREKNLESDDRAVPQLVQEDRKHVIEACIVRVMKSRRELHHNELVSEVFRQICNKFTPAPRDIKTRIESLIDREYLERSTEDSNVYLYKA
jgi:cullin 3